MIRWWVGAIGACIVATHALAAEPVDIGIGYLGHAGVRSTLSLVQQPADNDGLAGARLAIEDNNTTGKFLNQHFTLHEVRLKDGEGQLSLTVEDDGAGFDQQGNSVAYGLGLLGIAERVRELSGRMAIKSGLGKGTRLEVVLPRNALEPTE